MADEPEELGYWERKAAEDAAAAGPRPEPGPTFNPTSGYDSSTGMPSTGADPTPPSYEPPLSQPLSQPSSQSPDQAPYEPGQPYGPPPSQPVPPPAPAQQVYGAPYSGQYGSQYGSQPPGQYGTPGYPYGYVAMAPDHPSAKTGMVLGIVALAGCVVCTLTLFLGPFAWAISQKALREIRESNGQLGGESAARGGQVMGIIATVLLILGLIAIVVLIIVVASVDTDSSTNALGALADLRSRS